MSIKFFKTPADFRKWLSKNHESLNEQWVGFYKRDSGKPSITWPQSVDEALCFGWIDGIRKSIDEVSYKIRFTPRRPGSIWSSININRVAELTANGLMHPAGIKAYEKRRENKSGIYSYEQRSAELPEEYEKILRKNKPALAFFNQQPEWYRKQAFWYVVSAKKEETRLKRIERLIRAWESGKRG